MFAMPFLITPLNDFFNFSAAQVLVRFYVSPLTVFIIYHITQYVNTYYAIFANLFLSAISPADVPGLKVRVFTIDKITEITGFNI